jgi:carbamoyltransferase
MFLLGINSVYHESSAALIVDGRVVAAAEEERFNRVKHGKPARVDNAHELPEAAIRFCLESAGIEARQLDAVCYSFDRTLRAKTFQLDPRSKRGDWGDTSGEESFLASLHRVPSAVSRVLSRKVDEAFYWVPHHLAHAASTYYPSGFDDAAVLIVDGIGEQATTLLAAGTGRELTHLKHLSYPHSLGFLWEKVCKYLGFGEHDACKLMGLAGYGRPEGAAPGFGAFVVVGDGGFSIDAEVMEFRLDGFSALERILGPRRRAEAPLTARHIDTAAALQAINDQVMLALARTAYELHPSEALCMAGGVALNCTSNWVVKEKGPFEKVYIPSAPHDAGTAVGAALYVYHQVLAGPRTTDVMAHPYQGPRYLDEEIRVVLAAEDIPAIQVDDIAARAAEAVARGLVVGWFQGAMEFGPRALGNRSLLADPRDKNIREILNAKVKHREHFRPFAPSVLEEHADAWFELGRPSQSYQAMLFACPVRSHVLERIPAVLHIDRTARVQVVAREHNPLFHQLIEHFHVRTGVPLVLNTSFNDSEPIVCSPKDALTTFRSTRIDALAMGNYWITR